MLKMIPVKGEQWLDIILNDSGGPGVPHIHNFFNSVTDGGTERNVEKSNYIQPVSNHRHKNPLNTTHYLIKTCCNKFRLICETDSIISTTQI